MANTGEESMSDIIPLEIPLQSQIRVYILQCFFYIVWRIL